MADRVARETALPPVFGKERKMTVTARDANVCGDIDRALPILAKAPPNTPPINLQALNRIRKGAR